MLEDRQTFTRLPARARKAFGLFSGDRYRLWLADDHLLYVRVSHYSEYCKRFYFQDIQAITVCRTSAGSRTSVILGVIGVVLLLIGVFLTVTVGWPYALIPWFPAGIFGLLLLWNVLLGPTCVCRLYTTVQAEDIVAMRRLRRAEATLLVVVPLIEAAQGTLGAEELSQAAESPGSVETLLPASHAVDEVTPGARARVRSPMGTGLIPERHEHGSYHAAFFVLLLLLALSSLVDVFWQNAVKNAVDLVALLASFIVGIIAISKQRDSDMDRRVKNATTAGIVLLLVFVFVEFLVVIVYDAMNPEMFAASMTNPLSVKYEGLGFQISWIVRTIVLSLAAALGYLRLMRFRADYARRQSPPPMPQPDEGERREGGS